MQKRLIAAILLLGFLYSTSATAEMKLFPLWTEKTCDGQVWGCYNLEQMKEIVKLDLRLQLQLEKCKIWEGQDTAYLNLHKAYDLSQDIRLRLETRFAEKTRLIRDLSDQVYKYTNRDVWGTALPWVIVAIIAAFAGGAVTGVYLSK